MKMYNHDFQCALILLPHNTIIYCHIYINSLRTRRGVGNPVLYVVLEKNPDGELNPRPQPRHDCALPTELPEVLF